MTTVGDLEGTHWLKFDIEGVVDVVAEVDCDVDGGKVLSFKATVNDDPEDLLTLLGDALVEGLFEEIEAPDYTVREVPSGPPKPKRVEVTTNGPDVMGHWHIGIQSTHGAMTLHTFTQGGEQGAAAARLFAQSLCHITGLPEAEPDSCPHGDTLLEVLGLEKS